MFINKETTYLLTYTYKPGDFFRMAMEWQNEIRRLHYKHYTTGTVLQFTRHG